MTAPGDLFEGAYRVDRVVATSAEVSVFQATAESGATVALRLLRADHLRDPSWRHYLLGELDAASRLRHPNLAEIYTFNEKADGEIYAVSEWFAGPSLEMLLAERGPADEATTRKVLSGVLEALAEAHARGLVHRDIKPSNIFFASHTADAFVGTADAGPEVVKLAELGLGLARGTGQRRGPSASRPGVGTPGYVPSDVLAGIPATAQSDLYAVGVVAVEMATGRPAFPTAALAALDRSSGPTIPDALSGSPLFERVVARLLSQDPMIRFSSADQALIAVRELEATPAMPTAPLQAVPAPAAPLPAAQPRTEPAAAAVTSQNPAVPSRKPLWPWIAAALAVLLLAGGGLGVYWVLRNDTPRLTKDEQKDDATVTEQGSTAAEAGDRSPYEGPSPGDGAASEQEQAGSPVGDDDASGGNVVSEKREGPGGGVDAAGAAPGGLFGAIADEAAAVAAESGVVDAAANSDGSTEGSESMDADSSALPVAPALVKVAAGDPMFGPCDARGMAERCYVQQVPNDAVLRFTETDLGLSGSALSLVERQHPFELLVVGGQIRVHVPPDYLWARFPLKGKDGTTYEVLLYSDRALARKTLAAFARQATARWPDAGAGVLPIFAELAELSGDKVADVVIQGQEPGPASPARRALTVVMSADGTRVIDTVAAASPTLRVRRLQYDDEGPKALLSEGVSACDQKGDFALWRYDGLTRLAIFDTSALGAVRGLPERYLDAGASRRLLVVEEAGEVRRIEIYVDEASCLEGRDGYALVWR